MRFHTCIKETQEIALCKINVRENLNDKSLHTVFEHFKLWKLFN